MGICLTILLIGSLAIFWKKFNNRANSSTVHPEQHPHQQNQGFNNQNGNDTILNVMGILIVTSVLVIMYVPTVLISQKIIPPHPLVMVNAAYGLNYVPSLVLPITFAFFRPKSIKIGFQALPCCN
jgi:sterol desaturase/sphingolipid hydroxylase (fatty acid hydroxylase superfamily)